LVAAEGLHDTGPLDHHETRGLGGREAAAAFRALPSATDGESVVAGAGVDDPGIRMPAEGAVHDLPAYPAASASPAPSAKRASTASPWAGRISAFASATTPSRTWASAVRSYSMTCWGRRNV